MKFLSVRELRNRSGRLWKALESDDFVVTNNGKPVGLLIAVADDDLEASLLALQRARAAIAVTRMRAAARGRRTNRLTARQVDAVVGRVRRSRGAV
ncbi:MAG: hypothetical protein Q7R30_09095 [Acidobacteriota bacterium]|nr:hypothetical protein [Acidobacteriota bacterium]